MPKKQNNFQLLNKENLDFQKLLSLLKREFERVREKCPNLNITYNSKSPNFEPIIQPELFHQFTQLDVIEYYSEIFPLLEKLLPYFDQTFRISFGFDYASYTVEIKDIYNKIFEETFLYYIFWNLNFEEKLLSLINEWIKSFNIKKMSIEFLIPLKGFYLPQENVSKIHPNPPTFYNESFIYNDEVQIFLKSISSYSIYTIENYFDFERKELHFEGFSNQTVPYCILAKGQIKFVINQDFEDYSWCYLWEYIKQLVEAISLEGTLLRFGKPFYKFPWWVSRETAKNFKFFKPDWMNDRYMSINLRSNNLIPDLNSDLPLPPPKHRDIPKEYKKFLDHDFIVSKGLSNLNPSHELLKELLENYFNISNIDNIKLIFNKLSNNSSSLNYNNGKFILETLVKLSQREDIQDVILDTSLILESIFLGGDSQTEKSYRLNLYASSILASNFGDFKKEFDYFNHFYRLRSTIIHGSENWKVKNQGKSIYEKFIQKFYPQLLDLYNPNNFLDMFWLDKLIQNNIFSKISKILRNILKRNIKFPDDFEKEGFIKIILNLGNFQIN